MLGQQTRQGSAMQINATQWGTNPRFAMFYDAATANDTTPAGVELDIQLTNGSPEILPDVTAQALRDWKLNLKSNGRFADYANLEDHCNYKFLVSISGRSAQGPRLEQLLLCGSLVFMHSSPFREFWHGLIEPWVHVVQFSSSGRELAVQIDWAKAHPNAAARIARNGRELAMRHLHPAALDMWWGRSSLCSTVSC